jgi:murein L,D-transpeptidase YcbB/YkuD
MSTERRFLRIPFTHFVLFALMVTLLCVSSCRSKRTRTASAKASNKHIVVKDVKFDENDIADKIESLFSDIAVDDSIWAKGTVYNIHTVMQKAYAEEDYLPIWLTENGDTSYVVSLLDDLSSLKYDGLKAERYHVKELQQLLQQYGTSKSISTEAVIHLDTLCTRSYLQASRDLLLGAILPVSADSLWFHANDSVWKAYKSLAALGKAETDYPSLDSFRSKIVTYKLLRDAMMRYDKLSVDSQYLYAKQKLAKGFATDSTKDVIMAAELPWQVVNDSVNTTTHSDFITAYQYYIGAKNYSKKDSMMRSYWSYPIDTLAGKLALNMERLRWIQQNLEPMYVLVNVPLMELFFRVNGYDSMHMEVVVGKTIRQTPSLNARMANVVLNPTWGVPPTIMKKDVMPGIAKSGKAYLRKKGLKVYDFKGNVVDASVVNSNNYKRYVFRQDAGDDNSLGYVKFNLPNKWDIYLHDTPHREDFGKKDRFQSSGCIRVQKPKEMAEFILATLEGKRYTRERIDSVIETHKTRYEVLKNRIPVHVVYLTAFEDTTKTRFHFIYDMYKRDGKLKAALSN